MNAKARVSIKGLRNLPVRQKGEKRVYLLLNHATTYDIVALMHVAKNPIAILMDKGAFAFPVIGSILKRAGFIPLDKGNSKPAVEDCIDTVNSGVPLLISLHEGNSTLGQRLQPRTGAIRIAHMTGAKLFPIFLKVENESIRHLSFRGVDSIEYPYTTFRNTFLFIDFLPPVDLSALPPDPIRNDFFNIASLMDGKAKAIETYYDSFLENNKERLAPLRRKGGTQQRIIF